MSAGLIPLATKFAERFGIGGADAVLTTLKQTCFKGNVTDPQMAALLIVADQYSLNPFLKEIYAFPDKNNGIIPVVGVDGWSRIINEHPQFDGMEFKQDDDSCTCIIYRKDRKHPVSVTEYMAECRRPGAGPWSTHPKRMLRHKATIQCSRLAFGFAGIYDPDEAERIREVDMGAAVVLATVDIAQAMADIGACTDRESLVAVWKRLAEECNASKDRTAYDQIKDAVSAKGQEFATETQG